jgi:hypothetical protein
MIDASGNIFIEILEANVRNPNKENFKIFFADDMTEIKAKDSEGNIIPFAGSGGGAGNTIYNADDDLTSDRTVEGAGFTLDFINLLQFRARANDINLLADRNVSIFSTTGYIQNSARNYVFVNLRTYTSTILAQADGTLPIGAIYNLTAGPGGGNDIRIKV